MSLDRNKNISKPDYSKVRKTVGIKVQKDGTLTRLDDVYSVMASEFIVDIDRTFLSNLSNNVVSSLVEEGMKTCKKILVSKGLKVIGSHMQSHPPVDEPHIVLQVVYDESLSDIVENMNDDKTKVYHSCETTIRCIKLNSENKFDMRFKDYCEQENIKPTIANYRSFYTLETLKKTRKFSVRKGKI